MRMILKISRTELRNLFYSPVAWFLTLAFLVQCAIFYTYALAPFAKWQDIVLRNDPAFKGFDVSITQLLFLNPSGIFSNVLQNLYLFVPLLTMGIISREINNGTIKLLYSSPVTTRQIVLGKYLAIMSYNFLLVCVLGIFLVSGFFNIRFPDYGILLSAVLAFYLLVCAYAAIGMFMSCLSNYQIVSAIGCFIVIFVLSRIGGLWQQYDFVRDLTYFLSMSGRTGKMLRGLITSNDVIYFVVIVCLFLCFTLFRLQSARQALPWYRRAGRYVVVSLLALTIGYLTSRPGWIVYWDATADKINTLHPNTQKIIQELGDEPLEVTLYTNLLGSNVRLGLPENRNDYLWNLWEPYLRFKPGIRFHYQYYYDNDENDSALYKRFPGKNLKHIAREMADGYDVRLSDFETPSEMRKKINLRPENFRLVMKLQYKGRTTFLRTFDDGILWPEEQQIAAAFKRLLQTEMPRVLFATGHLERDIFKKGEREFRIHSVEKVYRYSLTNVGFDADTISLETNEVPDHISSLVLADPKTVLGDTAMVHLRRYIDRGGNLMILGEPGKQEILNPVLQQFGLRFMNGVIVQPTRDEMPHMVKSYVTGFGAGLAEEYLLMVLKSGGDSVKVMTPGAVSIDQSNSGSFHSENILMTLPGRSWVKSGPLVVDSAAPVFDSARGDVKRISFPTSVALTRQINGKEQRIVICGDADFLSNSRVVSHFLGRAFYSWMDYSKFPIYTPRPNPKDDLLRISYKGAGILIIVYVWVLPALVLISGIVLLIRRKRQ